MDTFAEIVRALVQATIFATVLALGLSAKLDDIGHLLDRPRLFARSVIAMYVVVPLVAVALVLAFQPPRAVQGAMLLMAISAGAPVLPKRLLLLKGNPAYIYSLSVLTALLAIVTVPVWLALLGDLFDTYMEIAPLQVATVVGSSFLAPLLAGMLVRRFFPAAAGRLSGPLTTISTVALAAVVVLVIGKDLSYLLHIGLLSLLVIVLMTLAALATGHLLGGPILGNRASLAIACATRHPALVLLIATQNFPNARALPVVAAFLLINTVAAIPYMIWIRRRHLAHAAAP